MLDELVKMFRDTFEKYGNPKEFSDPEKYNSLNDCYTAYEGGILKEYLALCGKYPKIEENYDGNIDELIDRINNSDNFDSAECIVIYEEINNIDHLNKLRETYPDKEIVLIWNDELSFIDNVISSVYMIDYYKSLIDENLSVLEKVTLAYDIVKSYPYKDCDKNFCYSREITKIVDNNYIVCVGYVQLFNRILKELGIETYYLETDVIKDESVEKHARSIMYIYDEKYNIDGVYIFDPTYDSMDKKYYYVPNEKSVVISQIEIEGCKIADNLSSYGYFLVPSFLYELRFPDSTNEKIYINKDDTFEDEKTNELLHGCQESDEEYNTMLPCEKFLNLLYNVKLEEGYNEEDIIDLLQESLLVSNYGYVLKDDLINEINNEIIYSLSKE